MADYLHKRLFIRSNQAACVSIDRAANVILLTDTNYEKYRRGEGGYYYYGGHYRRSPVIIQPPRSGHYNLVVDLGGRGGMIKTSSISVIDV